MIDEEFEYDVEKVKKDIVNYLETEGFLNPIAYTEIAEVEKSDDAEWLISKADRLGINVSRYKR